ncbi:MAG TPA: DUF3037 domain-containing protein [Terriglobales bacterium]
MPESCEYFLIRIAPDPIRNESINIGVALYHSSGSFVGVRVNRDFRRAHCLFPQLEEADLTGLEGDVLKQLQTPGGRERLRYFGEETCSHGLQFTAPSVVMTQDPVEELDRLYAQYAATPEAAERSANAGARRVILRHLAHVFNEERVLARMQRNVRAGEWLGEPDAFRFDFHYKPNGTHHVIQALPLEGDESGVKELCFTVDRLRQRLRTFDVVTFGEVPAPLRAVELPNGGSAPLSPRGYHRSLLAQAGVRVLELHEAAGEAGRIRAALGIQ